MRIPEDRVQNWFNLVKCDISLSQWELARTDGVGSLAHRSCPWGGHLVRLDLPKIQIHGTRDPSAVLVRPEVRSRYAFMDSCRGETCSEWVKTFSPGDALIEQGNTMPLLRLAALLFGDLSVLESFTEHGIETTVVGRQRLRRDFPEKGDCTYLFEDTFGHAQEYLLTLRHEQSNFFQAICIFSTPQDKWYDWFVPFFSMLLAEARTVLQRYLNRPGIQELRLADERFYIVLALRHFNRGPPMFPSTARESTVIQDGHQCGLSSWMPFDSGPGPFCFAEYLREFLEQLGHVVSTYDTMDGRALVPYQCVMVREHWMELRETVLAALKLQRMAYRFRHGGTTAPNLLEDVVPRIARAEVSFTSAVEVGPVDTPILKMVIRNTFLELEDDVPCSKLIDDCGHLKRSKSAHGDCMNFNVQFCKASI